MKNVVDFTFFISLTFTVAIGFTALMLEFFD